MKAVIGLDLSLTSTGICDQYGNPSTCAGRANLGDRRLHFIGGAIYALVAGAPDLAVIESIASQSQRGSDLGMVHGVVRYELMRADVPYALVNPVHLKLYATGKSSGPGTDKSGMALAAYKRGGMEFLNDDECDAWWLRAMGLDQLGEPLFELPAAHRRALDKVEWPVLR